MNQNSPVYPTNETFEEFLSSKGSNNIITALPGNRHEYQDLYDGYTLSNDKLGLLIGEYNYFYKELTNLNNLQLKKVYFNSQFINRSVTGCKGDISILGRYFSSAHKYIDWNDNPRNSHGRSIYTDKEIQKKGDFVYWNRETVSSLKDFLRSFIMKQLKESGGNIIITSIPNKNKKNRFEGFLNGLDRVKPKSYENRLMYCPNLFQVVKTLTHQKYSGYEERKKSLSEAYKVSIDNKHLNNAEIIIIDDIFTSGAHLEECLRALIMSGANKYSVHGVFLAATQRPEYIHKTLIDFGIPKIIEVG
jgi:hypothetical protein